MPSLSLAKASSLRIPSFPVLNPRSISSPRLLKPLASPPLPILRYPALHRFPPRSVLGILNRREIGFLVRAAEDGGGEPSEIAAADAAKEALAAEEARGQSTMPERFRYLTKEAPERPVRWPWVIALLFLAYCWRTVLWELSNWKKAALAILNFLGYLSKLALAFVFHFIGSPITGLIRCIQYSLYVVRCIYSNTVAFAPVPELTRIILFTSTVLAIAEATVRDSVNSQPYLLTLAGIIGLATIKGFVPELLFWLFLSGMFCYSLLVKKRDSVSAALPSAALLAAIGEPWLRGLAIASYLALDIAQHSKSSEESVKTGVSESRRLPVPLLLAALSIGIHVAAKWLRFRHLTWMIV